MKKFMTRALGALAVSATLALVACGGGGGGGTPAPTPTPNTCANGASDYPTCTSAPTVTGVATTPATGATDVATNSNVQLVFTTNGTLKAGTSTVDATCNGTAVSGNIAIGGAAWTFDPILGLPEGSTCTVKFGGTFTNVGGLTTAMSATTVFTTHSTATGLHYTDKVIAEWTNGAPYMVTKTSVTKVTNNTSYQSGAIPLSSCGAANKSMSDGYVLNECTAAADLQRHVVKIDPTTGIATNYVGAVPSDITFTVSESNSTQPVAGTTSCHALGGWFYADPNARWRLLFQADAGGAPTVVKEGDFAADGTIKVLRCYSN